MSLSREPRVIPVATIILGFLGHLCGRGRHLIIMDTTTGAGCCTKTFQAAARQLCDGKRGTAIGGCFVEAPPWSSACTTDHGPSRCGQPIVSETSKATPAGSYESPVAGSLGKG